MQSDEIFQSPKVQPRSSYRMVAEKQKMLQFNYYRAVWCYCLFLVFLFSIIIYAVDKLPYIDCLFLSVSAYTSSGLSTVGSQHISSATFAMLYILMNLGGIVFLLLPPMIYRIHAFHSLEPSLMEFLATNESNDKPEAQKLIHLISERRAQIRGVRMVALVIIFYLFVFLFGGIWIFLWIISAFPRLEELRQRGFSNIWYAAFMVSSAFCNCGLSLTSDSVHGLRNWPLSYLWLAFLILAGNNLFPVMLRGLLRLFHKFANRLYLDRNAIAYALDHPRQMTTHLLDKTQTRVLILILLGINIIQYAAFLSSSLPRKDLDASYGTHVIAGAGFFQTISTRSAGLQIYDLNNLNQGMPAMYIFLMYLSAAPFVSRMYISEQTLDEDGHWKPTLRTVDDAKRRFHAMYLFRHLSFLVSGFLILCFIHDKGVALEGAVLSPFPLLFELISAYGNVGLSFGIAGRTYSLSGAMSTLGKLIIMGAMLLGKHRALPTHTDMVLNFKHTRLRRQLIIAKMEAGEDVVDLLPLYSAHPIADGPDEVRAESIDLPRQEELGVLSRFSFSRFSSPTAFSKRRMPSEGEEGGEEGIEGRDTESFEMERNLWLAAQEERSSSGDEQPPIPRKDGIKSLDYPRHAGMAPRRTMSSSLDTLEEQEGDVEMPLSPVSRPLQGMQTPARLQQEEPVKLEDVAQQWVSDPSIHSAGEAAGERTLRVRRAKSSDLDSSSHFHMEEDVGRGRSASRGRGRGLLALVGLAWNSIWDPSSTREETGKQIQAHELVETDQFFSRVFHYFDEEEGRQGVTRRAASLDVPVRARSSLEILRRTLRSDAQQNGKQNPGKPPQEPRTP
ncbi:hypothetical protein GUITHDRAFT_114286 [Guillardia theta CCMP2712]|uniref:Uncharacterized protein n=2 Tax=Guillardia theta TaxID=55529 RepID=L1ITJ7_GUITC|nr:hypothetical protein GUITHDRAFT_114286 [Guillardia theta CCMP2712]EKX39558.1 hypothetical protein GUITHDRAFT_114286 [Guillardia theta CCMP2712]|eukprot:XP_005826538.1 hypothetical protein GUITHDRAFT_114286 [Guillardia theta CCMP2712]